MAGTSSCKRLIFLLCVYLCACMCICVYISCMCARPQTVTLEGINSGDKRPTYNISYSVYKMPRYVTERKSFVDSSFVRSNSDIYPPLTGVGVRKSTSCRTLGYFDGSKYGGSTVTPRACQQQCLQDMQCLVVLYMYKSELFNGCHFCNSYPGAYSTSTERAVTNIFLAISAKRPKHFQNIDKYLMLQKTKAKSISGFTRKYVFRKSPSECADQCSASAGCNSFDYSSASRGSCSLYLGSKQGDRVEVASAGRFSSFQT